MAKPNTKTEKPKGDKSKRAGKGTTDRTVPREKGDLPPGSYKTR